MQRSLKHAVWFGVILFTITLLLAACNFRGVAGFSRDGSQVAIISRSDTGLSIYVSTTSGESLTKVVDSHAATFDVSFNPSGDRILYVMPGNTQTDPRQLCTIPLTGLLRTPNCILLPSNVAFGVQTYLPDGSIVVGYSDPASQNQFVFRLYDSSFRLHDEQKGIDHWFLSPNAYKLKRTETGNWYFTMQTAEQPVHWVISKGENLFIYTATREGLSGPNPITARLSASTQELLKKPGTAIIRSVSPNGRSLAFNIGGPPYDLYVVDLTQPDAALKPLAQNAVFPIQYRFSPDGTEIAFESPVNNHSIWVANTDGSNPRELARNASLEGWHGP